MPKTDRSLTSDERTNLTRLIQKGLKRIGAERAAAPEPDKLQQLISQALDMYRKLDTSRREALINDASISLGSLWGQVICDQMGWTWVLYREDSQPEQYAVVPPDRAHLIFPMLFISDLLDDPSIEQNSLLLYESVKSGTLPLTDSRDYFVLGARLN